MSVSGEVINIVPVLEGRAASYSLLARLFLKEVDRQLLDQMMGLRLPAHTGNDNLDKAYRLLQGYLSQVWERTLSDLAKDYVRTFIGNSVDALSAAYPSESVHTTGLRLVMQDARDEVLAIYRSVGVDKAESWHEGEDHVAVELEFMQVIAERSVEAAGADDDDGLVRMLKTQLNFLTNHLSSWVPMLVEEMQRFAKTDFYRAVGYWLLGFLETDEEFLRDTLDVGKPAPLLSEKDKRYG
jgi:TorA maturation chaperone TorD